MNILSRYPEQASDRRGLVVVGLFSVGVGIAFGLIEARVLAYFFVVAGLGLLAVAVLLGRSAFAWLQRHWFLFG